MRVKRLSRIAVFFLCLLLLAQPLWAATVTQTQSATLDTWHTGSATLASGSQVQSAAVSLTNPGHLGAWCTLAFPTVTTGSVAAGTSVIVWFQVSTDGGATYPDGSATVNIAAAPDMIFPLNTGTVAQQVNFRVELGKMPLGFFKVLIKNDSTGATLNTTWTLKCRTHTLQSN